MSVYLYILAGGSEMWKLWISGLCLLLEGVMVLRLVGICVGFRELVDVGSIDCDGRSIVYCYLRVYSVGIVYGWCALSIVRGV